MRIQKIIAHLKSSMWPLLFLGVIRCFSQGMPEVIPPSPEVAALGKFTEVPVSLFSGLPNISIPITTFEVGDRSFPVSMQYHARGNKVAEIASRVGLGWTLNAGGAVFRQVRHVADDESPYGYIRGGNSLTSNLASGDWFSSDSVRDNYAALNPSTYESTDRLPDMFTIGVDNLSAKFILDYHPPYDPVVQKYDDLSILYDTDPNGIIESFVVTDKYGYKYYFGVSKDGQRSAQNWDKNMGNYAFPSNQSYILTPSNFYKTYNSWLLMDIESPHGELASFTYEVEVSTFFRRNYDTVEDNNVVVNYSSKIESYQYQLREIVHRGGKILFLEDVNGDRDDLQGSHALKAIEVYDFDQNLVKTFELNQSYQTAVNDNNQLNQLKLFEPESSKRLFLDSVVEKGKNGAEKPPYVFTYNSTKLPNRFSNSQDYWGYYNNANNGSYLTFFDEINSMDRRVDEEASKAGILEKITYPTGGATRFVYEHNKGNLPADFDNVLLPAINPEDPNGDFGVSLGNLMWVYPEIYDGNKYSKTFTIGPGFFGNLDFIVWFQDTTDCSETVVNQGCRFQVQLSGNGNTYELLMGNHSIFTLSPGTYTLTVDPTFGQHDPENLDDFFGVSLSWQEAIETNGELYAAGKRVKRVEFLDQGDELESFKEYEYQNGTIFGIGSFYSLAQSNGQFNVLEPLGAVPGSPLSTYQGNTIGYGKVIEYHGDNLSNIGKTEHTFTMQLDTGDYTSYPYHPPTDNEWLRGLPLSQKTYRKEEDNSYTLLRQVNNQYLYGNHFLGGGDTPAPLPLVFTPFSKRASNNQPYIPGTELIDEGLPYDKNDTLFRLPLIHMYYPDAQSILNGDYEYKVFHFTGGTLDTFSTSETFFQDNGIDVTNNTQYGYGYANHYQVASTARSTSDGESLISVFNYPQDLVGSSAEIDSLVAQNRHVPIVVKDYKDLDSDDVPEPNELLKTTITDYGSFDNVLGPAEVRSGKGIGPNSLRKLVEYHKYDSFGNPLEVSYSNGPITSYIWGYNKTLPIAKIENATYTQISAALSVSEAVLKNFDESDLAQLNGLRNNPGLSGAMVTTYTYEPLVGTTSITDPKGMTISYTYDNLSRLKEMRDLNDKIISENTYHYKNH